MSSRNATRANLQPRLWIWVGVRIDVRGRQDHFSHCGPGEHGIGSARKKILSGPRAERSREHARGIFLRLSRTTSRVGSSAFAIVLQFSTHVSLLPLFPRK